MIFDKPSSIDLERYLDKARNSPRLTSLLPLFSRLANASQGVPLKQVELDPTLLGHDALALDYKLVRDHYAGAFNRHFLASVPFVYEEQCRLGAAIISFSDWKRRHGCSQLSLYTLGDGPGVSARALADYTHGFVKSLSCSPNRENMEIFERHKPVDCCWFFHGPFFDVTASSLLNLGITSFVDGFDIIIEDTTFQMYGLSLIHI